MRIFRRFGRRRREPGWSWAFTWPSGSAPVLDLTQRIEYAPPPRTPPPPVVTPQAAPLEAAPPAGAGEPALSTAPAEPPAAEPADKPASRVVLWFEDGTEFPLKQPAALVDEFVRAADRMMRPARWKRRMQAAGRG